MNRLSALAPLRSRVGVAALAAALLASVAGCGSQASDEEIIAALGGASTTAVQDGATVPATGVPSTSSDQVAPVSGAPAPGAEGTIPGAAVDTGTGSGVAAPPKSGAKESVSASTVAGSRAATLSPVKIGTLGVFSGVLGAVTQGGPKALAAWAAYTNAHGGLNGHPVKVIVGDDQGDPATSLTLAKRMVESDKIIAMVGNVNVFGFPQLDKYMTEKKVPMIGGDGVDPGWFTSTNTFPVSTAAATQIIQGLKTHVQSGVTKIAILYCLEVSALCTYMTDEAKKSPEVGKYIVQTYQVSLVAPSYTSQCLRMQQAGIEMMYLLMDTAGAARAVQNCATQGFKPKSMLLGLDATKEMPTNPALVDSTIPGAVASPATLGVPLITKYQQVMATYAPTVGDSGFSVQNWAAAEMFGMATKNLSANPTTAELYEALYKVKGETLGGMIVPVTYVRGKPAQVKPCIFVWAVKDGKFSAPNGAKPSC